MCFEHYFDPYSPQALNRTGWFESVEGQECNSNVQRIMNNRYHCLISHDVPIHDITIFSSAQRFHGCYSLRMGPRTLSWVRRTVWFICTARLNHFTHVHFPQLVPIPVQECPCGRHHGHNCQMHYPRHLRVSSQQVGFFSLIFFFNF